MTEVVILGAGLTGLSCAYHFEKNNFFNFKVFEKNDREGGLLKSFKQDGFTFDFTGHLLHISDSYFLSFLDNISKLSNFNLVTRNSGIYIDKKITPYPFQTNLYGLPQNIILDSIYGFINRKKSLRNPKTFNEWVLKYFGSGIGKHFFFPYNKKLFAFDVKKITPSWTGRFVPKTNLKTIIKNAISPKSQNNVGYNNKFYYPKSGGIEYLIKNLKNKIQNKIHKNHNAINIDLINKIIYFENGHKEKYKYLISTIPLNILLKSLTEPANLNLHKSHSKLLCNSVLNFNLGFNVEKLTKKHWIYFPQKEYPFYRIGFWNNVSPTSVQKSCTAIYGEVSYLPEQKTEKQIKNLTEKSINKTLKNLKLKTSNVITKKILHLPHAYVIYNFWREKNLKSLLEKLKDLSIHSTGRYGEWKYSSMQEAVLDGKKVVENMLCKLNFKKQHNRIYRSQKGNENNIKILQ
ncbi:FAD-dependent oxidoreductase [Candidatus Babeliales bacterium]|nr:FAD-dependent oxidoreductase [Candidatus Babeliales bacterium]